jgi:antitoxin (DNA-binding transcriptional repressor) of toxin-antitoxin stability system
MKTVSMYGLKQELSSIIAETEAGMDVLITRHNKPVARLTRPGTEQLHKGSRFGKASLKPAMRTRTSGRYLQFLEEDRRGSRK